MEVVFHADDVVFAGVFAHLHFHDYKRELAFVLQAVDFAHRDAGRFIRAHIEHLVALGTCRSPAHDDPMLGTEHIPLPYSAAGRSSYRGLRAVRNVTICYHLENGFLLLCMANICYHPESRFCYFIWQTYVNIVQKGKNCIKTTRKQLRGGFFPFSDGFSSFARIKVSIPRSHFSPNFSAGPHYCRARWRYGSTMDYGIGLDIHKDFFDRFSICDIQLTIFRLGHGTAIGNTGVFWSDIGPDSDMAAGNQFVYYIVA